MGAGRRRHGPGKSGEANCSLTNYGTRSWLKWLHDRIVDCLRYCRFARRVGGIRERRLGRWKLTRARMSIAALRFLQSHARPRRKRITKPEWRSLGVSVINTGTP